MYQPRFFKAQELVPPSVYKKMGDKSLSLIDDRVLMTLDQLRLKMGLCTINNWCFGGNFEQSGLRTDECKVFSPTSQHAFGRAMDCKFRDHTAEQVRQFVINNKEMFPYITFIESDVTWFHFDVRNGERITLWSPKTGESKIV
ncbi:hypothetical protein [Bacterioplanoides sp.]|uniref:hypothetical protein n=1 Tax=Bacterioplanoides sp. TaxID=2066072 RepID=UPI003B5CE020